MMPSSPCSMSISFRRPRTTGTVGRPLARSKSNDSAARFGGSTGSTSALDDLVAVERLDQVLVGAELQAGETILHLAAPGDEDDADLRRPLHGLERLADVPAAALRHHHVE